MTEAAFRILLIAFGYALACLAGIATLVIAAPQTELFTLAPYSTTLDVLARAATIVGLVVDAPIVTVAALGLAALVIAEIARLRSWLYHVLAWGAAAGFAAASSRWLWDAGAPSGVGRDVMMSFVASGFVAGFVYWLVAGRTV